MAPATVVIDVKTEKVVKVIHEIGAWMKFVQSGAHRYYTGSRDQPAVRFWA